MYKISVFADFLGLSTDHLSRVEKIYLEIELFFYFYNELRKVFLKDFEGYFKLMHFSRDMEFIMIEQKMARLVVNDILQDYTLEGIAYYTAIPEDVVYDVAMGTNTNPSIEFISKVMVLHREVKRDLYEEIKKKVIVCYS